MIKSWIHDNVEEAQRDVSFPLTCLELSSLYCASLLSLLFLSFGLIVLLSSPPSLLLFIQIQLKTIFSDKFVLVTPESAYGPLKKRTLPP